MGKPVDFTRFELRVAILYYTAPWAVLNQLWAIGVFTTIAMKLQTLSYVHSNTIEIADHLEIVDHFENVDHFFGAQCVDNKRSLQVRASIAY